MIYLKIGRADWDLVELLDGNLKRCEERRSFEIQESLFQEKHCFLQEPQIAIAELAATPREAGYMQASVARVISSDVRGVLH